MTLSVSVSLDKSLCLRAFWHISLSTHPCDSWSCRAGLGFHRRDRGDSSARGLGCRHRDTHVLLTICRRSPFLKDKSVSVRDS